MFYNCVVLGDSNWHVVMLTIYTELLNSNKEMT